MIYRQRSPQGFITHAPVKIPGWELLDVFRVMPDSTPASFPKAPGIEEALNRIVKVT